MIRTNRHNVATRRWLRQCLRLAPVVLLAAALAACTDELLAELEGGQQSSQDEGIAFTPTVTEQAQMIYGATRSAADTTADTTAMANAVRPLQGDGSLGLNLHTLQLPVVGIHPHTVGTAQPATTTATRARVADIVSGGSDPINFHDSLTIWGYTDRGRPLFRQVLLSKVRGFRSSVHWPYDHEVIASWSGLSGYAEAGNGTDWLNPKQMCFYALAPSMEDLEVKVENSNSTVDPLGFNVPPHFTYTVPNDIGLQRDLLYGTSGPIDIQAGPDGEQQYPGASTPMEQHLGQDDKQVGLSFRHVLTAVRFAQGKIPTGTRITQIRLTGIANEGTYYPEEVDEDATTPGRWHQSTTTTGNYTIKTNWTSDAYEQNVYIDDGYVLFLMPHEVSSNARLEVTLNVPKDNEGNTKTDTRTDVVLSADLGGNIWKQGYTVTYKITVGQVAEGYYLLADVKESSKEHSDLGGSFTIHSYRHYLDYSQQADADQVFKYVPWQVSGFSATGVEETHPYTATARPSWLNSIDGWYSTDQPKVVTESDAGSTTGQSVTLNYTLKPQQFVYKAKHSEVLDKNARADKKNLEADYGKANCYIVNANGSYSFPIYYGDGNSNSYAFIKDHTGRQITHADIPSQVNHKDSTTSYPSEGDYKKIVTTTEVFYDVVPKPTSGDYEGDMTAELVWTDAKDVFSNVNFDTASKRIQFDVNKATPCNAVIALKGKKRTRTTVKYFTNEADETAEKTETSWDYTTKLDKNGVGNPDGSVLTLTPEILWTWHIWVTDEVLPNANDNYAKNANGDVTSKLVNEIYPAWQNNNNSKIPVVGAKQMLPVNLGWVPKDDEFGLYEERNVWVEVVQTAPNAVVADNQKIRLKIHQDAKQDPIEGTSTVYQWGRPTALPSLLLLDKKTPRAVYNSAGTEIQNNFVIAINDNENVEAQAISHPLYLYKRGENNNNKGCTWFPEKQPYWSSTAKTLYDPCPPGYQLPASTDFGTFIAEKDGKKVPHAANGNKYGHYFYTEASSTENSPIIFMPTTGEWKNNWEYTSEEEKQMNNTKDGDNKQSYINKSKGIYWTGDELQESKADDTGFKSTDGYILKFGYGSDATISITKEKTGFAMPIRPVSR